MAKSDDTKKDSASSTNSIKFCPNCGARQKSGTSFCTTCGTKIASDDADNTKSAENANGVDGVDGVGGVESLPDLEDTKSTKSAENADNDSGTSDDANNNLDDNSATDDNANSPTNTQTSTPQTATSDLDVMAVETKAPATSQNWATIQDHTVPQGYSAPSSNVSAYKAPAYGINGYDYQNQMSPGVQPPGMQPGYVQYQQAQVSPAKVSGSGALIATGIILLITMLLNLGWSILQFLSNISFYSGYPTLRTFNVADLMNSFHAATLGAECLQTLLMLFIAIAALTYSGKTSKNTGLVAWGSIGFGVSFLSFTGSLASSYYLFGNMYLNWSSFHLDAESIGMLALIIFMLLSWLLSLIFTAIMMRVGFKRIKQNHENQRGA